MRIPKEILDDSQYKRIWDVATKTLVKAVGRDTPAVCAGYSPDAHSIAVGHENGTITILDGKTLSVALEIKGEI